MIILIITKRNMAHNVSTTYQTEIYVAERYTNLKNVLQLDMRRKDLLDA